MTKKEVAIKYMTQLNIYKPYIEAFREEEKVCFFENFGGFYADEEPEVQEKKFEIEKEHGVLVYAITHEYTEFGECYSFLIVTQYSEEWDDLVISRGNKHAAFAYVWNKDDDWCSEFGSIGLLSFGGGIKRIS